MFKISPLTESPDGNRDSRRPTVDPSSGYRPSVTILTVQFFAKTVLIEAVGCVIFENRDRPANSYPDGLAAASEGRQ